jgi:pimeloyl-ACP methyl ester carboxylesterase
LTNRLVNEMSPQTRPFRRDGVGLTAEYWGDPQSGPAPAVLLHGGGQTRHSWGRTAERLYGGGRSAVLLDARGHGDSDWDPRGDYSIDAFADDLLALLDALGRPAVLIGASLGGITSLITAGQRPDLVAALVLVDVVIDVEPEGVKQIQDFMAANPEGFGSLEEVHEAIATYNPLRKRPLSPDSLRKNVRLAADGRWYWHWDPAILGTVEEPIRRLDRERLVQAATSLTVPTLIIRGGRSNVVGDAGLATTLQLIPHAQLADVSTAGHMVAGDDNDLFGDALERFLGAL